MVNTWSVGPGVCAVISQQEYVSASRGQQSSCVCGLPGRTVPSAAAHICGQCL